MASVAEDSTLSIEGVRVFDVEASKSPSKQMQMSLYVVGGTLSLKQTSGLNFSTGDGVSDPAMQFTGSLADLNKALQNLSYVGDEDFNSNHHAEFLKVYVNDLGSTIGGGGALTTEAVVPITVNAVNDAPSIVSPRSQQIKLSGYNLEDRDHGATSQLSVTVSAGSKFSQIKLP